MAASHAMQNGMIAALVLALLIGSISAHDYDESRPDEVPSSHLDYIDHGGLPENDRTAQLGAGKSLLTEVVDKVIEDLHTCSCGITGPHQHHRQQHRQHRTGCSTGKYSECAAEAEAQSHLPDWPKKSTATTTAKSQSDALNPLDEVFPAQQKPHTTSKPADIPKRTDDVNGPYLWDPLVRKNTRKFFDILVDQMPPAQEASSKFNDLTRLRRPVLRLILGVLLGFFAQTMGVEFESVQASRHLMFRGLGEAETQVLDSAILFMEASERKYASEREARRKTDTSSPPSTAPRTTAQATEPQEPDWFEKMRDYEDFEYDNLI